MKITQVTIGKIAEVMINHPRDQVVLYESAEVGIEVGGRHRKLTVPLVPVKGREPKELWRMDLLDLTETVSPKLKYKTNLIPYLYQEFNKRLATTSTKLTGNPKLDTILKSKEYQQYLTNDLIDLETYVNTPYELRISDDSTSFVNKKLRAFHLKDELQELHEEARKLAVKDKRAVVNKPYTYKKVINDQYREYQDAFVQYLKDFEKLRDMWAWKIEGDGLHMGYSQDEIYNKILVPLNFRLTKMDYNNGIIGKVDKIVFDLQQTIDKSKDERIIKYTVSL